MNQNFNEIDKKVSEIHCYNAINESKFQWNLSKNLRKPANNLLLNFQNLKKFEDDKTCTRYERLICQKMWTSNLIFLKSSILFSNKTQQDFERNRRKLFDGCFKLKAFYAVFGYSKRYCGLNYWNQRCSKLWAMR